jgi:beta-mannosidase
MKTRSFYIGLSAIAMLACQAAWAADSNASTQMELSDGWTFKQVRGSQWYPAAVPGVVQTDLMANNLMEDPYLRLNERSVQWVDKEDWLYKTTFTASADIMSKDNAELYFKGLDLYADVYLNDSLVLQANNMFREWRANIKKFLRQGSNELRIYLHSPIKVDIPKFDAIKYVIDAGNDQSQNGGIFNKKVSVFARKAGYHYGWDWGPRLVTMGIWRPVYIVAWNNARISNVHYRIETLNAKQAQVRAIAAIEADKEGMASISISAQGIKNEWSAKVNLTKGMNQVEVPIVISNPKLWWSSGLGEQHRYAFTAAVSMNGTTDSRSENVGLRTIEVIRSKDNDGTSFYFRLNGVNVFAKGANYIPQDNFLPRVTLERHQKTIADAKNANMNMLRVWGGGIYEDDMFYEECDRAGIMVWQDFMFACSTYPMNPDMLANIRQEAIDNVVRLRNHACIAIWCGNNENHTGWFNWGWMRRYRQAGFLEEMRKDYKDLFDDLLPKVVAEYDPKAFYWNSSPYAGDPDASADLPKPNINPNGDAHYWGVWGGGDSIASYNLVKARFFSEYGFQSFPEYQSVLKYAPEQRDHDIYSDVMMAHQRGGTNANQRIERYLLSEYRKPKDFRSLLYLTQLLQGDAIKTAMEAHRRGMPYCMGTLFWQHNDCWPVASWSSRDYYGRWKAQHYFAKKAYEPILVSPIHTGSRLSVYVVSDFLKPVKGTLKVRILDLAYNDVVFETTKNITIAANASAEQFSAELSSMIGRKSPSKVVVHAVFTENGSNHEYANSYFLTRCKNIDFSKPTIAKQIAAAGDGYDVTLTSNVYARGVYLSISSGADNFFSDNYFDLLPAQPLTIHVATALKQADFEKQLNIISIVDAY